MKSRRGEGETRDTETFPERYLVKVQGIAKVKIKDEVSGVGESEKGETGTWESEFFPRVAASPRLRVIL